MVQDWQVIMKFKSVQEKKILLTPTQFLALFSVQYLQQNRTR